MDGSEDKCYNPGHEGRSEQAVRSEFAHSLTNATGRSMVLIEFIADFIRRQVAQVA